MGKPPLDREYRLKLIQAMDALGQLFKSSPPTSDVERSLEYLCDNVLNSLDPIFQEYIKRCGEFIQESPGMCVVNTDGTLNAAIFSEEDIDNLTPMETPVENSSSKKQSLWGTALAAAMGISLSGLFNKSEEDCPVVDSKLEQQQIAEYHELLASLDCDEGNF